MDGTFDWRGFVFDVDLNLGLRVPYLTYRRVSGACGAPRTLSTVLCSAVHCSWWRVLHIWFHLMGRRSPGGPIHSLTCLHSSLFCHYLFVAAVELHKHCRWGAYHHHHHGPHLTMPPAPTPLYALDTLCLPAFARTLLPFVGYIPYSGD